MKYFKDNQNNIFAYDDEINQLLIKQGLIAITEAEADALRAPSAAQIKQAERNQALADLEALDRASVRDMREYIAAKVDAPAALKARELAAIALREKIK